MNRLQLGFCVVLVSSLSFAELGAPNLLGGGVGGQLNPQQQRQEALRQQGIVDAQIGIEIGKIKQQAAEQDRAVTDRIAEADGKIQTARNAIKNFSAEYAAKLGALDQTLEKLVGELRVGGEPANKDDKTPRPDGAATVALAGAVFDTVKGPQGKLVTSTARGAAESLKQRLGTQVGTMLDQLTAAAGKLGVNPKAAEPQEPKPLAQEFTEAFVGAPPQEGLPENETTKQKRAIAGKFVGYLKTSKPNRPSNENTPAQTQTVEPPQSHVDGEQSSAGPETETADS